MRHLHVSHWKYWMPKSSPEFSVLNEVQHFVPEVLFASIYSISRIRRGFLWYLRHLAHPFPAYERRDHLLKNEWVWLPYWSSVFLFALGKSTFYCNLGYSLLPSLDFPVRGSISVYRMTLETWVLRYFSISYEILV